MSILELPNFKLRNLGSKNILLGKNGSGKSFLLKQLESSVRGKPEFGLTKYISPERGGLLTYESGIEQAIAERPDWLADTRRANQAAQFRQQSTAQFRRLKILVLEEIEKDPNIRRDLNITFDTTVETLNTLLDRIYIKRADPAFELFEREANKRLTPADLSSGESELISLGIECLVFAREIKPGKQNWLLFDEPDVHLHPDLQFRLVQFLSGLADTHRFSILLATHSTAIVGALADNPETTLAFMKYGTTDLNFARVTALQRKILPIFGAHPLSNVFNQHPALLLDGEDDERIWQQAVRSSDGKLRLYPCSVDGAGNFGDFERDVQNILNAVYDRPIGYSLRDRDDDPEAIDDLGCIRRMRLRCHTSENLLLTDEVLSRLDMTWERVVESIKAWLANNSAHPHYPQMKVFADGGYNRISADIKDIRIDLLGILGTSKPWEVVVGQAIASIVGKEASTSPNSLAYFLGDRLVAELLGFAVPERTAQRA